MGSMVMDGAVIEPQGMLAAGAMLTPGKVIPTHEIWAGRPAKKMRDMTAERLHSRKLRSFAETAFQ